jgi:hypothetical protein
MHMVMHLFVVIFFMLVIETMQFRNITHFRFMPFSSCMNIINTGDALSSFNFFATRASQQ